MLSSLALIEFPADDPDRARSFWSGLLGQELQPRTASQGEGWQASANATAPSIGVHPRGRGPGDSYSLPYFEVEEMSAALVQVPALGGSIVHPGERWAICKDSEGNPFGLALRARAGASEDAPEPRDGADHDEMQPSRP
jgi:predicted enzyme related to lactoylglutathione lyase